MFQAISILIICAAVAQLWIFGTPTWLAYPFKYADRRDARRRVAIQTRIDDLRAAYSPGLYNDEDDVYIDDAIEILDDELRQLDRRPPYDMCG